MALCRLAFVTAALLATASAHAQSVQILHTFGVDPGVPGYGLVQTPDGSLYGTADVGGTTGVIYRLAPGGAMSIVHRFESGHPWSRLVRGPDGGLYGTTGSGGAAGNGFVYAFDPASGALRRLYEFAHPNDGMPTLGVTFGPDGLLYGATPLGGGGFDGAGTLFRINPATGATTIFHRFLLRGPDGHFPATGLTLAADGRLYGGTAVRDGGEGTLYRVDPATATVTTVLNWDALGWSPEDDLTATSDGALYGVTSSGGPHGGGTVFRVDLAAGTLTLVHAFGTGSSTDGFTPHSSLVAGPEGHLYGTTVSSQASTPTLFRVRRQGGTDSVEILAFLDAPAAGWLPAPVLLASDGFIHGLGEPADDRGRVFRFDPLAGGPPGNPLQLATVYAFQRSSAPSRPTPPALAGDGRLYGLTSEGGASGRGFAYRLTPSTGALDFLGEVPGAAPPDASAVSPLALAADGRLYGTAFNVDGGEGRIISVDPATGAIATALVLPSTVQGLSGLTRLGDTLYGIRDENPLMHVYRFDAATAAATDIASFTLGQPIRGYSDLVAAGDRLCGTRYEGLGYWTTVSTFYCVDPSTGAISFPSLGVTPAPRLLADLASGAGGQVYIVSAANTFVSSIFVTYPVAGTGRLACTLPGASLGGLTVLPDGNILGLVQLRAATPFRCNPATGAVELLPPLPTTMQSWSPLALAGDAFYYGSANAGPASGGMLFRLSLAAALPALDLDGDGLPNTWEGTYGLDPSTAEGIDGPAGDPDHDGVDNAAEFAAGTHPRGFVTRYLAEGATGSFFRTRLAIFNPTREPATVLVRFLTDAHAVVARTLIVPGLMPRALDVETLPGLAEANFSIVVESDRLVTVDRTMRWDATGYGSHSETALTAPATTWFLAEGSTSGDFSLFYLLQNPQASPVTATVRYLRPFGVPPLVKTYTLPPLSRTTIGVDGEGPELASTDVAAAIEATAPIIVERSMYLSRPGQLFSAGHDSAGVVAPALSWFLAEGATGPFFDLFVLVANPNPAPAAITVEYLVLGGGVLTKDYVVPPNGRFTIWVDDEQLPAGSGQKPLANAAVSTTVRSTNGVPVIVERTMWWPGPEMTTDFWYEAHNSPGSTVSALRWAFADGEVGGAARAETYVLIANPEAAPGVVLLTVYFDDGTGAMRMYNLPPKSRTNVALSVDLPETLVHTRFGVVVESFLADSLVPIVVERATYSSPGGVTWASGTNALAVPLP